MRCPGCGEPLDPEEDFCLSCGHILHPERLENLEGRKTEPERTMSWLIPLLVLVVGALFILAAYHPILARLFPAEQVQEVRNAENSILCPSREECLTSRGCELVCSREQIGVCDSLGLGFLDSAIKERHCTCFCSAPEGLEGKKMVS